MPMTHHIYPLFIPIALAACASNGGPEPAAPSEPGPATESGVSAEVARATADEAAREELERVEAEHRQRDPDVNLPLEEYEVTMTERTLPDGSEVFDFYYEFNNPEPGFEVWLGHGMHFNVQVNRRTGQAEIIGGE